MKLDSMSKQQIPLYRCEVCGQKYERNKEAKMC